MLVITFGLLEKMIEFLTEAELGMKIDSLLPFLTGENPFILLKDFKEGAIFKMDEQWHICFPIELIKDPYDLSSPKRNEARVKKLRLNTIRNILDYPEGRPK